MKGLVAVVNPRAGSGRAGAVWDALVAAHPELAAVRVVREEAPLAARRRLAEELAADPRAVLVVGGDGSIHHIAAALLAAWRGDVPLGIVPVGTGSDLAAALGVPRDPGAALQRVMEGEPRRLDVIEVVVDGAVHYAVNVASAGLSGLVDEAISRLAVRTPLSYLSATLRAFGRYRPLPARLEVDGEPWLDGELLLVAFANGPTFGRGMRIAPRAVPDDGAAEVVAVLRVPGWQLPWRLLQLYLGRHLGAPQVRYRRGRTLRFVPRSPFPPLDLDGELVPSGEAALRVLPGALIVVR